MAIVVYVDNSSKRYESGSSSSWDMNNISGVMSSRTRRDINTSSGCMSSSSGVRITNRMYSVSGSSKRELLRSVRYCEHQDK